MAELKPCPFCGSSQIYETHTRYYNNEDTACVFCNACKTVVILEDNEGEGINDQTRKAAREAWNTRAGRTCTRDSAGNCSDCGAWIEYGENFCYRCGAKVVE